MYFQFHIFSLTLLSFIRNQISLNVSQFLKYLLSTSDLFLFQNQIGQFVQLYNLFMGSSAIPFTTLQVFRPTQHSQSALGGSVSPATTSGVFSVTTED